MTTPLTGCPVCGGGWLPRVRPERCPQCGAALRFGRAFLKRDSIVRLAAVVATTPYPVDAFELVYRSMRVAIRRLNVRELDPHLLCAAVCRFAAFQLQDDAASTLLSWNIRNSLDVGKILTALATAGFVRRTTDEAEEDYIGLFEIPDIFQKMLNPWRGTCQHCGYDLRGSDSPRCPECGAPHVKPAVEWSPDD